MNSASNSAGSNSVDSRDGNSNSAGRNSVDSRDGNSNSAGSNSVDSNTKDSNNSNARDSMNNSNSKDSADSKDSTTSNTITLSKEEGWNRFLNNLTTFPFPSQLEPTTLGLPSFTVIPPDTFTALETPFSFYSASLNNQHRNSNNQHRNSNNQHKNSNNQHDYIATESSSGESTDEDNQFYNDDIPLDIDLVINNKTITQSIKLTRNNKYGLVGRNGIGKSTLLKALRKRKFGIPKCMKIFMLEQDYVSDEKVIDFVGSDTGILRNLGFTKEKQESTLRSLSGGWRMRAQLAKAIHINPDLLLLDEPTNFLDIRAITFLEHKIREMKTVIVVSHDRAFLDRSVDTILFMQENKIDVYKGNYTKFKEQRNNERERQRLEYENIKAQREHIQEFIDRFRYNSKRSAQAQSRIKLLEKLPKVEMPKAEGVIKFRFEGGDVRGVLLEMKGVNFRYSGGRCDRSDEGRVCDNQCDEGMGDGGRVCDNQCDEGMGDRIHTRRSVGNNQYDNLNQCDNLNQRNTKNNYLLNNINFTINQHSRMVIVGQNGMGKSTLLKICAGILNPTIGTVITHPNLKIGYFAQHHVDHLDLNQGALSFMLSHSCTEEEARAAMGRFGLHINNQKIGTLSGGQKSRLAFSALSINKPSLLILDEPTNHLDIETIEALSEALVEYEGAILCVSHDVTFIEKVFKEVYVCEGGIERFRGTVEDYKRGLFDGC